MIQNNNEKRFYELADVIISSSEFQPLKSFIQHGRITTYEHSLRVARVAFDLNRRLHINADESEVVLAGLLHDFYLYDWHECGDHLHGYHHPSIAAQNAADTYDVNDRVISAIQTHMWPLTLFHIPNNRVGWLVTVADKMCSLQETILER